MKLYSLSGRQKGSKDDFPILVGTGGGLATMMLSELFPENKETEEKRKKTVTSKSSDLRSACETLPKRETEEGAKQSGVSPFECAQHCVFAGRYLGLKENKDYKTGSLKGVPHH